MGYALPDRVRLGDFEIDLRAGEVRSDALSRRLQEKPLRVLILLIERPGELVARDEIQRRLWPNDTIVDFENGINTAVKRLRQALQDSADNPKYIENIPRRGYRLLVPVEPVRSNDDGDALQEGTITPAEDQSLLGKKVSHYRVLEIIGGGGMGLVYKAEDLKLGRQVALKFLPPELATDTVALQRFEREAKTASWLDHPNICTIHEVEEHNDQPFIVMQLLEGETLRDRLARLNANQKLSPLDELLNTAAQVCAGLRSAHEKGIIHRDIKPANIFITSANQAKILDFGLAKLVCANEEGESRAGFAARVGGSTSVEATLTRTGPAMGTAGYMSPEQVRREKLDSRSDIFSFGLVLYEMATGQRAFTGETPAAIQDAIQTQTPVSARHLNSAVTPKLDAVIVKALQKDKEQRYQNAACLGSELQRIRGELEAGKKKRHWPLWIAACLAIAIAAIWFFRSRPVAEPGVTEQELTANPQDFPVEGAAISPDGKYVAYHDRTALFLRSIESGEIHPVVIPAELPGRMFYLCWSPTGENLLVEVNSSTGWNIWVIPIHNAKSARLLYRNAAEPTISHDGQMIAFVGYGNGSAEREIWVGSINGGAPHLLVNAGEQQIVAAPAWSPDSRWIAYARRWRTARDNWSSVIEVRPVEGGAARTLVSGANIPNSLALPMLPGSTFTQVWLSDWRLVFSVQQNSVAIPKTRYGLWQITAKPTTGAMAGVPEQLTQWWDLRPLNLTVTADSKSFAIVKSRVWADVFVGDLTSPARGKLRRLTLDDRGSFLDAWTQDGQAILFDANRSGKQEIFKQALDENVAERIISGRGDVFDVDKTPDGMWFLYAETKAPGHGDRGQTESMWLMRQPTGGGLPEKVLEIAATDVFSCSSNAKIIFPCLLSHTEGKNLTFYSLDPVRGRGRQVGTIEVVGRYSGWGISPDGSRVALVDEDKFGKRVEILALADHSWHEIRAENSPGIFQNICWTADGKTLLVGYVDPDGHGLLQLTMDGKAKLLWNTAGDLTALASPNGKSVAINAETSNSNIWIIERSKR